jgi:hypothetical protein
MAEKELASTEIGDNFSPLKHTIRDLADDFIRSPSGKALTDCTTSARILNSKICWFCSEMEVDVVSGHNTSTSTGDMLVVCFIMFLMVNLRFGLGWCM